MRGLDSWRGMRLWLILVIFAVTLAALLGGQGLARNIRVRQPLARALASIPGVRGHGLTRLPDGGLCLALTLDRVPDLEKTVTEALASVAAREKEAVEAVVIRDHRQGLDGVYYTLRFGLEEAIATGRYTALKEELDRLAGRAKLDRARVYLGARFIMVQLEKDSAYLYEILRRPERPAVQAQGGGV